jgi:hypothetical protein
MNARTGAVRNDERVGLHYRGGPQPEGVEDAVRDSSVLAVYAVVCAAF